MDAGVNTITLQCGMLYYRVRADGGGGEEHGDENEDGDVDYNDITLYWNTRVMEY